MMKRLCVLALCAVLTSCASVYPTAVSPTPWQTSGPAETLAGDGVPQDARKMLYVTDRNILGTKQGFGTDRSTAMAFGHVRIDTTNMGQRDFDAYMSGHAISDKRPRYAATLTDEIVQFPGTPLPFAIEKGVLSRDRRAIAAYKRAGAQFQAALTQELEDSDTGKVILYVHGFNNTFEDGAFNLNELWSASGRSGVPLMFSWPTGGRKALGYFSDTQSGDFSVYHLKETLRLISATASVDEIIVVTHSHGASIVTSALRELLIESRGAGVSMRDTYRIDTLIMAAPDIDLGVMEQRLVAEAFGIGFGQIDVYLNPGDNALGLAGWIFGSPRFGAARPDQLSPESRAVFQGVKSVHFIMVEDANQFDRHNYFRLHPGVLADIAVTLRTGARPGDRERGLEHMDLNFWQIDQTYRPGKAEPGRSRPALPARAYRNHPSENLASGGASR